MANATAGRMWPAGPVSVLSPSHAAPLPISGAGYAGLVPNGKLLTPPDGGTACVIFSGVPAAGVLAFAGSYKITGQTLDAGLPVRRDVLLFPQSAPALCIRYAYSDASGNFAFYNLAAGSYIVLGIDKSAARNAVVYDFVTAVAM